MTSGVMPGRRNFILWQSAGITSDPIVRTSALMKVGPETTMRALLSRVVNVPRLRPLIRVASGLPVTRELRIPSDKPT